MAYIKDIIISIIRATKALLLAGFGRALIVGETAPYYLLTAGTGNAGLKITAKATRGTVYIKVVIVDPAASSQALSVARTGAGTSNSPYIITINLATNGSSVITSTATLVKAAIEASTNANAIVSVALVGDGTGVMVAMAETFLADPGRYHEYSELKDMLAHYTADDAEYKMAAAMFMQSPRPSLIAVYSRDPSADITTTLNTIISSVNNKWYGLVINNRTKAELQAAGTWASANKKLFFGCTSDLTTLDDRNNDREVFIIHDRPTDYPDCAIVGQNLAKQPGSITWKWKVLAGQIACNYDTTTLNIIREKNGIALTEYGGAVYTNEGKVTSGEFIDVIMGLDWVESELESRQVKLFLDNPKIKIDNPDLAKVQSVVISVMIDAGKYGIIAEASSDEEIKRSPDGKYLYTTEVPQRSDISANDRAARTVNGVEFTFELAGAVHKTNITGLVAA